MATINLFRIDNAKLDEFHEHLHIAYNAPIDKTFGNIVCNLYIKNESYPNDVKWKWVLKNFEQNPIQTFSQPIGLLEISYDSNNTYVVSFGNSFYNIDGFCDKNFAFNVARRFRYKKINSTAQSSPNTNKSKTIISYYNSNYFEYESGEAFLKIKGKILLDNDFEIFKENIEIGTSIKFEIKEPSVQKCIKLVDYLQNVVLTKDVQTPIPIFIACDKAESELCDRNLKNSIENNDYKIRFADFDIIGTEETFYSSNLNFYISYSRCRKEEISSNITQEDIENFCIKNNLILNEVLLDIKVYAHDYEKSSAMYTIKELIDYTDNERKCVLVSGKWYRYNDDYLEALNNEVAEIEIIENESFNWKQEQYDAFIAIKQKTENIDTIANTKKIYYNEKAYNILMSQNYGFENYDRRNNENVNNIEICDLYKNKTTYSVKIGSTSNKLGYAVEQSLLSIKAIKNGEFPHEVDTIGLWFVLEKDEPLPRTNGNKPDLTKTRMLVLKNMLANWLKEVRRVGKRAVINIGYKNKES